LQWGPTTSSTTRPQGGEAAPRRAWSAIYQLEYKVKVTVPTNPIQIADAALYISLKTNPSLGIKDTVELNRRSSTHAVRPAAAAEAADQEVLGARLRRDRPVQSGDA